MISSFFITLCHYLLKPLSSIEIETVFLELKEPEFSYYLSPNIFWVFFDFYKPSMENN